MSNCFLFLWSCNFLKSFIVPWFQSFLCLFCHDHSMLAETRTNNLLCHERTLSSLWPINHRSLLDECITNCAACDFFLGKLPPTPSLHLCNYSKSRGFHQWAIGSVIIVLPHSAIESNLTNIYFHANLWDYYLQDWANGIHRDNVLLKICNHIQFI